MDWSHCRSIACTFRSIRRTDWTHALLPKHTNFSQASYAGIIGPLVYDTLVFAAISWRLIQVASVEMNCRSTLQILFSRKGLPAFTARILVDGQIYYL